MALEDAELVREELLSVLQEWIEDTGDCLQEKKVKGMKVCMLSKRPLWRLLRRRRVFLVRDSGPRSIATIKLFRFPVRYCCCTIGMVS